MFDARMTRGYNPAGLQSSGAPIQRGSNPAGLQSSGAPIHPGYNPPQPGKHRARPSNQANGNQPMVSKPIPVPQPRRQEIQPKKSQEHSLAQGFKAFVAFC